MCIFHKVFGLSVYNTMKSWIATILDRFLVKPYCRRNPAILEQSALNYLRIHCSEGADDYEEINVEDIQPFSYAVFIHYILQKERSDKIRRSFCMELFTP